jgi:PKD repeat protein
VDIVATASGSGFDTATPESVTIRLVPPGVILPPAGAPTAAFTFSPTSAAANAPLLFDASSSQVGTGASQIVSYAWTFGDGASATGKNPTHTYTVPGSFNVVLTVTNDRTLTNSTSQTISVGVGAGPSATFEFSPKPVVVLGRTFFDAGASRAAPGHTITQYQWNWGDAGALETHSSQLADHAFAVVGIYTVVLTVTDEAGQQATTKQDISVGSGAPVPLFSVAVTNAATHTVTANGSASTATGTAFITTYAYDWGDGVVTTSSAPIQSHSYAATGSYPVKLTVTDNLGRVGPSQPATVAVP